jgi:alpha-L-fucosidase 2
MESCGKEMLRPGDSLSMRYPARSWKDGFPCGNGRIGAIVYGRVHLEKILFNHESYYYRSCNQELPDVSSRLPVLRRLLMEGKLEKANGLYGQALRKAGYDPAIAIYQPGFDLNLRTVVTEPFRHYRRVLNMSNGETVTAWKDGETEYLRRFFVSREGPFALLKLSATRRRAIDVEVSVDLHDSRDAVAQDGNMMDIPLVLRTESKGNLILARGHEGGRPGFFEGLVRIHAEGGELRSCEGGLHVKDAGEVLVFVQPMPASTSEKDLTEAARILASLDTDYEAHLHKNQVRHFALYGSLSFQLSTTEEKEHPVNEDLLAQAYEGDLPPLLVEKLFNFGRYLLLSSSSPGGLPAHLQGVWNGDYDPPWNCFYMANENIQMNYWQALPGNLTDCMLPLFDYYESRMEDFRTCARRLFGCRGIYIPAATAPDSGLCKILQAHLLYWTGAAGWLARHFYDYYRYTQDEGFLRQRALPFMLEAALFYEDFLYADETGRLLLAPGVSPENHAEDRHRPWSEGGPLFVSINPTMEVAICRELFHHLLEASETTGLHTEKRDIWLGILERLPKYENNEDGAVREWLHPLFPDNYNHRHLSHIYPLFPGDSINPREHGRERDSFVRAVEKRLVVGLHEQTGWSLMHLANTYARLGQTERAHECLQLLTRSCLGNNFFTYHNDDRGSGITMDERWGKGPAFQIDANMGWTAAILEMLVFSRAGQLVLLPSLPAQWRSGSADGILCRGGLKLSIKWDLDTGSIVLRMSGSKRGRWQIHCPGPIRRISGINSELIDLSDSLEGICSVPLDRGSERRLEIELGQGFRKPCH